MAQPVSKPTSMNVKRGNKNGFRSVEEFKWWKFAFKKRPVVIERSVNLVDLKDFGDFPQFNRLMGWNSYFSKYDKQEVNKTVCREFVASLLPVANKPFYFCAYVRSTNVMLNLEKLSELIGIDPLQEGTYEFPYFTEPSTLTPDQLASYLAVGETVWPFFHKFQRHDLDGSKKILGLIVMSSIMPTTHTHDVTVEHARVLEAIESGRPFCLIRFFIQQIATVIDSINSNDSIKMGGLITSLCKDAGVPFHKEDSYAKRSTVVDRRTVNRSNGQNARKNENSEIESELERPLLIENGCRKRRATQEPTPQAAPMGMEELIAMVEDKFKTLEEKFTARFDALEDQLSKLRGDVLRSLSPP
jgi:hypothetical protein